MRRALATVLCVLASSLSANAVTIYTTLGSGTDTAAEATVTGFGAYNSTALVAPGLPNPMPPLNFTIQLYLGGMNNLSIKQASNFMGFSIELSVANQYLGRNSSRVNVPFLNYLANLRVRTGSGAVVRVGGNSQEWTQLFFTMFPNQEIINKTIVPNTVTPQVNIDADLFYMMNNISSLVGTRWYGGLPFADPTNTTGIASIIAFAEQVLGDNLIAMQLGNEPDLFGIGARARPTGYSPQNFISETQQSVYAMGNNSAIKNQMILLGPSICCNIDGQWSIDQVLAAGYLTDFSAQLAQLAVQYYPNMNCAGDNPPQAQDIFASYLMHTKAQTSVNQYLNGTAAAQVAGKPFVMFETNTASCAGFVGLSDSFGAALWAVDYTLQMAYGNFSYALFHFGGQNSAYNPFTPPPSNISAAVGDLWSTGPVYYSTLLVSEAMGTNNASQVVDLLPNGGNVYTPAYAIYENGNAMRVVLINFMNDPTGASDYTATILIGGGNSNQPASTPSTVFVRYLLAPSVTDKYNISWAGQTFGPPFSSDGRLQGNVTTETVQCDTVNGCPIKVKAPSAALVFLSAPGGTMAPAPTETFSTSWYPYNAGPVVNQAVLATSNGRGGRGQIQDLSTSHGKASAADIIRSLSLPMLLTVAAIAAGAASILSMQR
ncbi:glycoside hydrolase family 79 protein [Hydnum rufescens UP504]|uniref:Glycoside hydrolase family 79 protein n=1 Tax=Hydnum rufescens UP504 TaxID=1448309 RepID=A0A9P6AJQ5_9AGAM|nr:glycoside hydrolase family 79 protein [Hydnum rufescens UP504]